MTFFLVFLAILVAGFVVVMALGRFSRPGSGGGEGTVAAWRWERGEVPAVQGLVESVANLPPVLLPHNPTADDVDRLRFSSAFRGYRMDQVDEVLDCLRDELAGRDERISELENRAARAEGPGVEGSRADRSAIEFEDASEDRAAVTSEGRDGGGTATPGGHDA